MIFAEGGQVFHNMQDAATTCFKNFPVMVKNGLKNQWWETLKKIVFQTCPQNNAKRMPSLSQHDSKMILKLFQNHPQIIPKSCQVHPKHHPKIIPMSSQSCAKIIPKSSQDHPKIIPKSFQNHPKSILKSKLLGILLSRLGIL